jgi:hypothetical protein
MLDSPEVPLGAPNPVSREIECRRLIYGLETQPNGGASVNPRSFDRHRGCDHPPTLCDQVANGLRIAVGYLPKPLPKLDSER